MNINLASRITGYRIDAYGEKQYERIESDQKTLLTEIEGITSTVAQGFSDAGVHLVSDLMDADENLLLAVKGVGEKTLENVYDAVQKFIERADESELENDELNTLAVDQESKSTVIAEKVLEGTPNEEITLSPDSSELSSNQDSGIADDSESGNSIPDDQTVIENTE